MLIRNLFATCVLMAVATVNVFAASVNFHLYVDDYATVSIDGSQMGSYNNSAAAGVIDFTDNLTPGWHSFAIDYANQAGTNALDVFQQYPGDPGLSVVPLADFRSLDQSGQVISGLHADYYSSLGGAYQFTIYGEGPIVNFAQSFTQEIYQGNPGLWAGVYGPSAIFEERLSGDILIAGAPEPSSAFLILVPALALVVSRAKRRG